MGCSRPKGAWAISCKTACLKDDYPVALQLVAQLHPRSTLVFLPISSPPHQAFAASLEEITAPLRTGKPTNPRRAARKRLEEVPRPHLLANEVMGPAPSPLLLSLVKPLLVGIEESASSWSELTALF